MTAGAPLAMDIMTERHEVIASLRKRIVANEDLFGEFERDGEGPAIEIATVHHLYKVVNGRPLQRPPWYYDVNVQGDGMVDVQSHLMDQVQWLVAGDSPAIPEADVTLREARRWSTAVPLDLRPVVPAHVVDQPDLEPRADLPDALDDPDLLVRRFAGALRREVVAQGRQQPATDACDQRQRHRQQTELHGYRKRVADEFADRVIAVRVGRTEIAAPDTADVTNELLRQGFIEMVSARDVALYFRR